MENIPWNPRFPEYGMIAPEGTWAYRVSTGYVHDRGTSVMEVLKYEAEELGNKVNPIPYEPDQLALWGIPAKYCKWVCPDIKDVLRYADLDELFSMDPATRHMPDAQLADYLLKEGVIQKYNISGAIVLMDDDCGGILVLKENLE